MLAIILLDINSSITKKDQHIVSIFNNQLLNLFSIYVKLVESFLYEEIRQEGTELNY